MTALCDLKQRFTHTLRLLLLAATLLTTSHVNASLISLETTTNTVFVGEQITVDIWVRELGTDFVSAFSLDLLFDTALVAANTAASVFGDKLGAGLDSFQDMLDFGGLLNVAELSLLLDSELDANQQSGGVRLDFLLASVVFDTSAVGLANFSVDFDPLFGGVIGEAGALLDTELPAQPLQVSIIAPPVNSVAEPSVIGMLISLMGIVLVSGGIRKGEQRARMARS